MRVPGGNLLNVAMRVIGKHDVTLYRDTGTTTSPSGRDTTSYATGEIITSGSVQAVPKDRYALLGLDMAKRYVMWYVSASVLAVARTKSGDQLGIDGDRYQVTSESNWYNLDGWTGVTAVFIGVDPDA